MLYNIVVNEVIDMKKFTIFFILLALVSSLFSCSLMPSDDYVLIELAGSMKTQYILGEDDALDLGNLQIRIKTPQSERFEVVSSDMISGDYDLKRPGSYTLIVNYGNNELKVDIEVVEPEVESVRINFPLGFSAEWFEGDTPDFGGVQLEIHYVNDFSLMLPVNPDMITDFDIMRPGVRQAVVNYGGKSDSFTYTVNELHIKDSEILTENFLSEFALYEMPVIVGLKLRINFEDDRIPERFRSIDYDVTLDMITGLDTLTAGKGTFTVSYRGCKHEVAYTVTDLPATANEKNFIFEIDDWGGYSIALKEGVELTGKVILPRRHNELFVTSVAENGFENCGAEEIELYRSVKAIGKNAFDGCEALKNINLENIDYIGDSAFKDCVQIEKLDLSQIVVLGNSAFENCGSVNEIVLGENLLSVGDRAFYNLAALTQPLNFPKVVSVGDGAFAYCRSLETVTFAVLKNIGDNAFAYCESLENIELPETLEELGDGVFSHCVALKELALPVGLSAIGEAVFYGCESLLSLNLPSIKTLPALTFADCSSLNSVELPNTVIEIGDFAFKGCASLRTLTIPENCLSIGVSSFEGCVSLDRIVVPSECVVSDYAFSEWTKEQTIKFEITASEASEKFGSMWKAGCEAVVEFAD